MYPIGRLNNYKMQSEVHANNQTSQADDSEASEAITDGEIDDIVQKQMHSGSSVKSKHQSSQNSGSRSLVFGSLLELKSKLQETEKRYRKLVDAVGVNVEMTLSDGSITSSVYGREQHANHLNFFISHSNRTSQHSQKHHVEERPVVEGDLSYSAHNGNECQILQPSSSGICVLDYSLSGLGNAAVRDGHQQLPYRSHLEYTDVSAGMMSHLSGKTKMVTTNLGGETVLSERRKHRCQMCTYQTDNISHLRRHQCTVHNADKLYHCYVCGMDFSRSERAKAHFLTIHPEIPYHSKIARKRPNEDGNDETIAVKCMKVNDSTPSDRNTATKHESGTMATRKSWEKYCQLVAPANGNGTYHFRCLHCEYQGPNIWHLKRHYLDIHIKSGSYSCRVCHYSTGDMQRLVSHMTGHGELFCSRCPFSTVELERFRVHLPLCTGSAPSSNEVPQCPVCGDEFADRLSVKSHVSAMHQRDYCDLCGCVVYGGETMEEHQRQHGNSDMASDQKLMLDNGTTTPGSAGFDMSLSADLQNNGSDNNNIDQTNADGSLADGSLADGIQTKIRFGRFSNQVYYCPFEGCGFKATWKKSVELHTLNYHGCGNDDDAANVDSSMPMSDQSPVVSGSSTSGLFNCAFCPNHRTFKYRKSFEKHLLQHGIDYAKHPYLVVRSTQADPTGVIGVI